MEQTAQQTLELAAPPGVAVQRACYPALAISVRQPWAWLIIHGGKDIENRTWPTRFRGRVAVHASKGMTRGEYEAAMLFIAGMKTPWRVPAPDLLQRGGIVGEVNIVDCVMASESPWFCGEYGFVLRDAKELPFLPCKGSLGFFRITRPLTHAGSGPGKEMYGKNCEENNQTGEDSRRCGAAGLFGRS